CRATPRSTPPAASPRKSSRGCATASPTGKTNGGRATPSPSPPCRSPWPSRDPMLTSETIRLASGRSWRVFGGGSGAPLLWLHGPRGVAAADPLLEALAAQRRIIAPLAPGFDDLEQLGEIDTIHELVLDYDDLLRGQKLPSLPIVG